MVNHGKYINVARDYYLACKRNSGATIVPSIDNNVVGTPKLSKFFSNNN